jgi:hypothetical protein
MELHQGNISLSESTMQLGPLFEDYAHDLEALSQSAKNGDVGLKDIKASLADMQSQLEMASGGTLDLSKDFENLQSAANIKQIAPGIDALIKKLRESNIPAKDLEAVLKRLGQGKYVTNLQKGYADVAKKTKAASKATKAYAKDTDELAKRQERVNAAFKAFKPEHKIGALEAISKTAGGLGQVAMAATSLHSAFSALANEDLSFGEKLTTFIMGMSMAIPSLISGIAAVKTGFVALTGSIIPAIVARKAYNSTITQEITAESMAAIVKRIKNGEDKQSITNGIANTMVKKGLIKEGEKEAFILALNAMLKKKENQLDRQTMLQKLSLGAAMMVEKLARMGLLPAKFANIAATTTETGVNYGLQASMLPILIITLAITAAILVLVATIWIIVSAVQALSDAYNKDAIAAEKAKAVAEALAESYKAIKQEYEDMVATMEEYKTARDALDNLTEGTREWYDAMREANEQAIELMNIYPELHKYATTDDNGLITISDAGLDYVAQQKLKDVNTAYSSSLMANAAASRAQNKADATQFQRDTFGDVAEKAAGHAIAQWAVMSFSPAIAGALAPLMTVVRAADMGLTMAKNIKGDDATEAALKIAETNSAAFASLDEFRKAMHDQGVESESLITSLYENKEALLEMRDSLSAYEAQLETAIAESVNLLLQNNVNVQNSKYASDISTMVQDNYADAYNEAYDKYYNQASSRGLFNTGTAQAESAMSAYAKAMGLDEKTGFSIDNYAGDGTVEYSYLENGDRQTKTVTAEEIATILATKEAEGETDRLATEFARFTENLNENQVKTLAALQSGKYTNLSEADMRSEADLQNYLSEMGVGIDDLVKKGDGSEEHEAVRQDVYEQVLKDQYGIDLEEWRAAIEQARQETAAIKEEMLTTLGQEDNADLTAIMSNLTVKENQRFSEAMGELVDFFDKEAGNELLGIVNDFASGLDAESAEEFYNQFGQMTDYADATQWEALAKAMKTSGDLTEAEAEALDKFIDESKDAAKAIKNIDMDKFTEQLKSLSSILNKLAKREIDFSAEEVEALKASGVDTSSFVETLDGFRYLGDITELTANIAQAAEDSVREVQENYENISERLEQAKANTEAAKAALEENANSQVEATTKIKSLWTMISEWFGGLWEQIQSVFGTFIENLASLVLKIYDGIVGIWNWAGEKLTDVWNWLIGGIAGLYNGLVDLLAKIGINMDRWEYNEATFERQKTSDEIQKEEDYKKAQEEQAELEAMKEQEHQNMISAIVKSADTSSVDKLMGDYDAQAEKVKELEEKQKKYSKDSKEYKELEAELEKERELLDAWDDALLSKAAGYKDLQPLIGKYQKDIKNSTGKEKEHARQALQMAIRLEEAQENFDASAEHIGNYTKALRNAGKGTVAFQQNLAYLQTELGTFFGEDVDDIFTDEWVANNLDNLEAFANGEQSGIDAVVDAFTTAKIASSDFTTKYQLDAATVTNVTNILNGLEFDINGNADMSQVINSLMAAGMTAQEVAAFLNDLGYTNIQYDVDTETLSGITDAEGNPISVKLVNSIESEGYAPLHTGAFGSNTYRSGGNSVKDSSDSGGGGEEKNTDEARGKKTDIVERYKEVDDAMDDVTDKMEDASKAADRLWGAARIAKIKEVNKEIQNELKLLKKKKAEADSYLIEDKTELKDAASDLGISFSFDANGNIANYEAAMTKVWEKREALLDSFGATMNEDEEKRLEELDTQIERLQDAISQYDETKELSEDLANEIDDKFYEWQDNNYEQLTYELELKLEVNDSKLEIVDYYLEKIEDDMYATLEAYELMNDQYGIFNDNLRAQKQFYTDLEKKYQSGEISLDAYKEGLLDAQGATIEQLQSMRELKIQMQEYYGGVLEKAQEEIALYTDQMEHLNSVLDHYSSIMEILGKEQDYVAKGVILEGKATSIKNELEVQTKLYKTYSQEANEWKAKMETAAEGSNEYETYKKNWEAAQTAANEAQENMLSKTEEWAEAMRACVENELSGLAKTLEESLTGGTNFDTMLNAMERASSLQEEYLTTTNQIYETNKLMRKAQQDIDKTTNSVAKRRLQGFINETKEMQNQSQLSAYELKIQQAKYDLLLAEIALEEAQDAKSTVRLQRDAEGNFGYVYTADSSKVAEAEQKLADAQNKLYNIGLDGANDYNQKYAETMQEMYDTLTELQTQYLEGAFDTEEEYQDAVTSAKEYYYDKLKQYSSLYSVAISADSRVIADAWSSDFSDMMNKTDEWKGHIDEYTVAAAASLSEWATVVSTVLESSGLDKVDEAVGAITSESEKLKTTLIGEDGTGGVVSAIAKEVAEANKLSEAYVGVQNSIDGVIETYEDFLDLLNAQYTNPSTPTTSTPPSETPTTTTTTTTTTTETTTDKPSLTKGSKVSVKPNARWYADSSGGGSSGSARGGTIKYTNEGASHPYNIDGLGWVRKQDIVGYDTGGYTGDWDGSYGKLAMLHKKELILNERDTENFLATMEVMERILQTLDLQSASAQLGGILSSPLLGNPESQVIEQQIHIEASFPEATDRYEIEEAFKSMANLASQYANRK